MKEHRWEPVGEGEPREEVGKCTDCGAWATSEQGLPCKPEADPPIWNALYRARKKAQEYSKETEANY